MDFDDDGNGLLSEAETDEAKGASEYTPCDPVACEATSGAACQVKTCLGGKGMRIERSDEAVLGLPCDDGDQCTTAEYCKDDGTCGFSETGKAEPSSASSTKTFRGKTWGTM